MCRDYVPLISHPGLEIKQPLQRLVLAAIAILALNPFRQTLAHYRCYSPMMAPTHEDFTLDLLNHATRVNI